VILHSLHLRRFCQHFDRGVTFSPRLNMVVGHNGSGKTNLLRGLMMGFTGDAGPPCTKAENAMVGVATGDGSRVEVVVEHGGQRAQIRRIILPTSAKDTMLYAGSTDEEGIRGFTEVNAALWDWLQVTRKQLDDYVFVKQRKIDDLIDRSETERGRELASLFGLQNAATIHKKLGDFRSAIEVPIVTGIDNMRAEVKRLEGVIAGHVTALATYADLPEDTTERQNTLTTQANAYTTRQTLERELIDPAAVLTATNVELQTIADAQLKMQVDVQTFDTAMANMADEVAEATAALATYATLENNKNALAELERQRLALVNRGYRTDPDYPVRPAKYDEAETARAQLIPLNAAAVTKTHAINQLNDQAAVCEACGQQMPGLEERQAQLLKLQTDRSALVEQARPLVEIVQAYDDYVAAYNKCVGARQALNNDIKVWQGHWATIPKPDPPRMSKERAESLVSEHARYVQGKQALLDLSQPRLQRQAELQATKTAKTDETAKINAKLANVPNLTADQSELARQQLEHLRQRERNRTTIESQKAAAEASLTQWQTQLTAAEAKELETAGTRYALEYFKTLRNVFHPNEAPRVVSFTYMQQIEEQVNDVLRLFEAPFSVQIDDALGFTATFYETGKQMADKRLSVGERIVLSMAFRIAVNATFAGSLGLLILDEPTAGLDEHNLGCLPRALEQLRVLSDERGLQIIFVTHEPRIAGYFDHVIDLGEPIT